MGLCAVCQGECKGLCHEQGILMSCTTWQCLKGRLKSERDTQYVQAQISVCHVHVELCQELSREASSSKKDMWRQ